MTVSTHPMLFCPGLAKVRKSFYFCTLALQDRAAARHRMRQIRAARYRDGPVPLKGKSAIEEAVTSRLAAYENVWNTKLKPPS